MTITKRLTTSAAQFIGAALMGYIAAYLTLHYIIPVFVAGLMASTGGCVVAVWAIGRMFRMRGTLDSALIGAGIAALIGYVILFSGAARDNLIAYATLALLPATLATVTYQFSDARSRQPIEGQ